jgi:Doubled CXXCH motif (Paired_CXXCH_1)
MPETRYTGKVRAKRITLHYFKQPHVWRRWKLGLAVLAPLLAGAWLLIYAAAGDQRIYTSGPLSTAHTMLATDCGACHQPERAASTGLRRAEAAFFRNATNEACLTCHDGPLHHTNQALDLSCAHCHVEHKGKIALADLNDRLCTQCHAQLTTKDGSRPAFAPSIHAFSTDHPEFAPTVTDGEKRIRASLAPPAKVRDPTQLSFNHKRHFQVALEGLAEVKAATGMQGLVEQPRGLQLSCTYCHRPDAAGTMRPITFAQHCAVCHGAELRFEAALPPVPHREPAIVHAFLQTLFLETLDACQSLPGRPPGPDDEGLRGRCEALGLLASKRGDEPRAPGRRRAEDAPTEGDDSPRPRGTRRTEEAESEDTPRPRGGRRSEETAAPAAATVAPAKALDWARGRVATAEKLVFKQRCGKCHIMVDAGAALPAVRPTAMPTRWLPHGEFDHTVHRPIACTECHAATGSTETADVLLPSIAGCRQCHRDAGGARATCVECHLYHDHARERDFNGPHTVRQFLSGGRSTPAAPPKLKR